MWLSSSRTPSVFTSSFAVLCPAVLRNLTGTKENRPKMAEEGIAAPLVAAVTTHLANADAVVDIVYAIRNMAVEDGPKSSLMAALPPLVSGLTMHASNAVAFEAFVRALWNVTDTKEFKVGG